MIKEEVQTGSDFINRMPTSNKKPQEIKYCKASLSYKDGTWCFKQGKKEIRFGGSSSNVARAMRKIRNFSKEGTYNDEVNKVMGMKGQCYEFECDSAKVPEDYSAFLRLMND